MKRKQILNYQIGGPKKGFDGEILKLDKLYGVTLENIIALRNGDDDIKRSYERFEEMYFQIVRKVVSGGATPPAIIQKI